MSGKVVSKSMKDEKKKMNQEVGDDDFITLEIMSRLPVKSLMRFNCVCKQWESKIHNDKFFIDLHLSRSITARRTSFLLVGNPYHGEIDRMCLFTAELLLPSNEEEGCAEVGTICLWEPPIPPRERGMSVCSLNGLICFMDIETSCALVYNSSTRQSSPWVKSIVKDHEVGNVEKYTFPGSRAYKVPKNLKKRWGFKEKKVIFRKHDFGYDPATKEHKVIAIWELSSYGHFHTGVFFCEVMTMGQNFWRRIDNIDPSISPLIFGTSVYLNGSIYFLCQHENADKEVNGQLFVNADDFLGLSIVEFNVGSEKFTLLERLAHCIFGHDICTKKLMAVNGRLCVSTREDDTSINMRTLYYLDENVQNKNRKMTSSSSRISSNSVAGSGKYHCGEETIKLPRDAELSFIRHIPETNLFIIGSTEDGFSFYFYNQKNKNYSIRKINCDISTRLKDIFGKLRHRFQFYTFTPNILGVN